MGIGLGSYLSLIEDKNGDKQRITEMRSEMRRCHFSNCTPDGSTTTLEIVAPAFETQHQFHHPPRFFFVLSTFLNHPDLGAEPSWSGHEQNRHFGLSLMEECILTICKASVSF